MSSLLARAIARIAARANGLTVAYMPEGVDRLLGEKIVRCANEERRSTPPFSILVRAEIDDDQSDPMCPRVSPRRAIEYRRGDRFAVVLGRRPDIKSFDSYREVIDAAYPASAGGELTLEGLSHSVVDVLVADAFPGGASLSDVEAVVDRFRAVLIALQGAYTALGQGASAWNAYWFQHVAIGLENLRAALEDARESRPHLTPDEVFAALTWASFGLPSPNGKAFIGRGEGAQGRAIADALTTHWADEESIQASCKQLRYHPDTRPPESVHALERVDWSGFNNVAVAQGNLLLAWQEFLAGDPGHVWALSELTERQFLEPGSALTDRSVEVCNHRLRSLALVRDPGAPAFVTVDTEETSFTTPDIAIVVPVGPEVDEDAVRRSGIRISSSSRSVSWAGAASLEARQLVVRGTLTGTASRLSTLVGKPISLNIVVPSSDPLEGHVAQATSGPVYLLPSHLDGVLFFPRSRTGSWARPKVAAWPRRAEPESDLVEVASQVHTIVAWSNGSNEPTANERPLDTREDGVASGSLSPSGSDSVVSGHLTVEVTLMESGKDYQSPLVAALLGAAVSADEPGTDAIESVRGRLEEYIAYSVEEADFLTAIGHMAATESEVYDLSDLSPTSTGAMLAPKARALVWENITNVRVSSDFVKGPAAERFRRAFRDLKLTELLALPAGDRVQAQWPSKTSWQVLWSERREQLEEYLLAYTELIESAASEPATTRFWATYPFSLSVWATGPGARCHAVLLSPLHPLRLTWLAASEAALASAGEEFRGLGGIVEGWNIPQLGPRENANGRMVAVPMDSGPEQIFAGWSLLIEASVDGFVPLRPPSRIAGLAAPGGATSGLNGAVVSAALRTYQRINPHVSTLSIDLAAFTEMPRLNEVDDAVLNAIKEWTSDAGEGSRVRGGIRVNDSLNRIGDVPRESLDRLLADGSDVPLVWTRYQHDALQRMPSNLRLLQDAGIGVEVSTSTAPDSGVVGGVPLRRYEVTGHVSSNTDAVWTRPSPPEGAGWAPFSSALRAAELAELTPAIGAQLYGAAIVDDAADWTVSGESLVSPSALAALVSAQGSGQQMLWEWRPPYLDMKNGPQLERRPFVSVVRVPPAFRGQVQSMLSKARGRDSAPHEVDQLIETLGARGVGLSSLVAMGGTHAAGALGFYLAFKMMESVSTPGAIHVAVPIDAFDSFLGVLAGSRQQQDPLRRADLLVIRVEAGRICLIPIEIKFYGFQAGEPPTHLPASAAALREPLSQLLSTSDLLQKVRERWSEVRDGDDAMRRQLWLHGLTSLVEAGIRLTPEAHNDSELAQAALNSLLSEDVQIDLGKPLVAFFGHQATTAEGDAFNLLLGETSQQHQGLREFGALLANTSAAFDAADGQHDQLRNAWQVAIEWAGSGSETAATPAASTSATPVGREAESGAKAPVHVPMHRESSVGTGSKAQGETPLPGRDHPNGADGDIEATSATPVGVRFPVGRVLNAIGDAIVDFWPGNTALTQMNVGVVGDLGTGKTQLLKALVTRLRREARRTQDSPLSILIFDYKRDFQDESFLNAVGGKLLQPHRIPLNVFSLQTDYTPLAAFQRAQAFIDIIAKIYSGIGPVQRDRLLGVITGFYREKNGGAPRLEEVLARYREESAGADSVTSVLNTFVLGEIFDDDPETAQSFEDLIDDRVLIVGLSALGADQNTKNAMVVLFLNQYFEYMLRLRKWPFVGSDPQIRRLNSFLLVDEAVNIMKYEFPVLMNLMLQGREFGVGVILASQYLTHFKQSSTNYGEPLRTWFIHRVPTVTTRELKSLGIVTATDQMSERVPTLGVHEALAVTLSQTGTFVRGTPFYELDLDTE